MALRSKSLFLYDLEVTDVNRYIDFKSSPGGPELTATLRLGFYSLTNLMLEVASAMKAADPTHTFTVTANRTFNGGTENRVTIATSHTFLSLLWASGSHSATSAKSLLGFNNIDRTGSTSYQGNFTSGTALQPNWWGKNFMPPEVFRRNFGAVNVSTSGQKEAVVFAIQRFIGVEFEHEPATSALTTWPALMNWMIQQRPFDFTPEIDSPSIVYNCTLEKTSDDGKGLAWQLREMLPDKPFQYTTGALTFRVIE